VAEDAVMQNWDLSKFWGVEWETVRICFLVYECGGNSGPDMKFKEMMKELKVMKDALSVHIEG
jgi:hypothetical protein